MNQRYDPHEDERMCGHESFFDRNCDEAWEQIKETFSHGDRILKGLLLLLAAAVLIGALLFFFFIKAPDAEHKGPHTSIDSQQTVDYGDGVQPRVDGTRKSKDYYTVLVLGRDTGGGGNTDTILLASYDVTNQKATVMSIPRDTMVNVSWDIKRINSVYNYNGQGEAGIEALYKEISQLVGFEPDYQVIVEWDAVGEIVEAMDGVYFDVPRDMNYDDPYQDLHIHQTKGYRLLSGGDVMQVLRYRHDNRVNGVMPGYADGDLGRIGTQQALLKAMISQLLQLKNVTRIGDFAKVVKNNVESDLSFNEMLWFGKQAVLGGLSVESINFLTMPNTPTYAYSRSIGNYQSYVVPNARELLDVVNSELSPFTEVFTIRDLDVMSVNKDGSLSSSTGYLEDSRAALPPVIKHSDPENEAPGEDGDVTADENGDPINPDAPSDSDDPPDPGIPSDPDAPLAPEEPDGSGTEEPTEPSDEDPSATEEPESPFEPEVPTEPSAPSDEEIPDVSE